MGVAVLLDTHAFYWAVAQPERLGPRALAIIRDPTSTLSVSAASACEVGSKVRLGRWPEAESLLRRWAGVVRQLGAIEAPLTSRQMLMASSMAADHRDPFDRMLADQAVDLGVAIITREAAFDALACDIVW